MTIHDPVKDFLKQFNAIHDHSISLRDMFRDFMRMSFSLITDICASRSLSIGCEKPFDKLTTTNDLLRQNRRCSFHFSIGQNIGNLERLNSIGKR